MLKNILNLDGAQKLTTTEQKAIKGGAMFLCSPDSMVACRTMSMCKYNATTGEWYCAS